MKPKTVNATIGQYSDYLNISDLCAYACHCCGLRATIMIERHMMCGGCHFRLRVMAAAGREEEFWKKHDKRTNDKPYATYIMAKDAII